MKFTEFNELKRTMSFEEALRQVGKTSENKEDSAEDIIIPLVQFLLIATLIPLAAKIAIPLVGVDAINAYIHLK